MSDHRCDLIDFDAVTLRRSGRDIVRDLSFRVSSGEMLVLLGPSGIGKTTVLKAAAGLLAPDAGTLTRSVGRQSILFQEARLLPWLSVDRNVRLAAPGRSVFSPRPDDEVIRLLGELGLRDCLHDRPHQLSGGMQRRVALARALIGSPDVVFADEPFANLDSASARLVANALRIGAEAGAAVLLTAHEINDRLTPIAGYRTLELDIAVR